MTFMYFRFARVASVRGTHQAGPVQFAGRGVEQAIGAEHNAGWLEFPAGQVLEEGNVQAAE